MNIASAGFTILIKSLNLLENSANAQNETATNRRTTQQYVGHLSALATHFFRCHFIFILFFVFD